MTALFTPPVPPDLASDPEQSFGELFTTSAIESRRIEIGTSCEEALYRCLDMRPPMTGSVRLAHKRYARAASRSRRVYAVLETICSDLGLALTYPHFASVPPGGDAAELWALMESEARRWCRELVAQMASDRVGRVVRLDDRAARFDFYEVNTERGIWRHSKSRVKYTHELAEVRQVKLPADHLPKPDKAKKVIQQLQQVPELARQCRILTGLQTSKLSQVQDRWQEDSSFAKGVKSAGRAIADNGKPLAAGAAVLGGAALVAVALPALMAGGAVAATAATTATAAAATAAPVAVIDPAICLGDVVFYGWD